MLWVARSGAPWRDLAEHYGSWKTVYTRFHRWQFAGIWDEILKHITTKIHAIVDVLGKPLRFELTAGNSHDCVKGYDMLQNMDLTGKTVIADRGYDMNNIMELIKEQQAIAVIPSRKHRKIQRKCDWWLYKERDLVGTFIQQAQTLSQTGYSL